MDVIDLIEAGEALIDQGDIDQAYSKFKEALELEDIMNLLMEDSESSKHFPVSSTE